MFEIATSSKTRHAYENAHIARGEMMRDLWRMLTRRA